VPEYDQEPIRNARTTKYFLTDLPYLCVGDKHAWKKEYILLLIKPVVYYTLYCAMGYVIDVFFTTSIYPYE